MQTNIGKLGNWLLSWVQENGAINGFHNHTVWGANPYRYADFTSGHSTWASLVLPSLGLALQKQRDPKVEEVLLRLLNFQTTSFQKDGQYAHIGFQMGETLKDGLIHNMLPNAALGLTADYCKSWLPAEMMEQIRTSILNTMEACETIYPFSSERKISNQEYARLWGKLLYQKVFQDDRWRDELVEQLDFMVNHYRIAGLPDSESEGSYRYQQDATCTEPAEYYGLLIAPLILAYETYGHERYLQHAGALCRHLARSSWYDDRGCKRFHRAWLYSGTQWRKVNGPMLIAGMGVSLHGIQRYLDHQPDAELSGFLAECDQTYAAYQNPRGYFASATGWQSEVDIAPSTAWHSHDFYYLVARHGVDSKFNQTIFEEHPKVSVLLGDQCLWVEQGEHWTVADYHWQHVFKLLGRKDEKTFGRDMDWVGGDRALPDHYTFPNLPNFLKTDEGYYLKSGVLTEADLEITSIAKLPYLGVWR